MNQLNYSVQRFPGPARPRCIARGISHAGQRGFSIVELMIALVIGIFITGGITAAYLGIKKSADRQDQMSAIQANVRAAFEFISYDARMAGALGCFPVAGINTSVWNNAIGTSTWPVNYAVALEGYNSTTNTVTTSPTLSTTASNWSSNSSATTSGATSTIPVTSISAGGTVDNADVLILRTTTGQPYRVTAATTATAVTFDARTSPACVDTTKTRLSGICPTSHTLISSCTKAIVTAPTAVGGTAGTPGSGSLTIPTSTVTFLATDNAEVFGLQTVIYYIGVGANGGGSLYRKVYNGEVASPVAQELIENVESMQVTYGVDTSSPADGIIDDYVAANAVVDWNSVVSVRVGLLLRSNTALQADLRMPTSITVNGQSLTLPTTSPKYERRAFVSTFAVRNHIKFVN